MPGQAPAFWWRPPDWRAGVLAPASFLYGLVAARRMREAPREPVAAPVLCVGNFTVGGSGKTPVAIALAHAAKALGRSPGFLSRGYGGRSGAARLVDRGRDSAGQVGDEPLLLAAHAPTAVTPDRAAGARLLLEHGVDFVIMDDGFQSARILIDHALMVIDARHGFGNGRVLPAGPLRAPLADQLPYADAFVAMGEGPAGEMIAGLAAQAGKPLWRAEARPRDAASFAGRRLLAFAGIGHPDRFFATVRHAGGEVVAARSFPDHHAYADADAQDLLATADRENVGIVTTAKDAVRLRGGGPSAGALLARLQVLEIEAGFEPADAPARIVGETVEAWARRRR